jgi:hypothetical protein
MFIPCIASIATAGNRFEEPGKERIGRKVAKSSPKWELRLLFLAFGCTQRMSLRTIHIFSPVGQ